MECNIATHSNCDNANHVIIFLNHKLALPFMNVRVCGELKLVIYVISITTSLKLRSILNFRKSYNNIISLTNNYVYAFDYSKNVKVSVDTFLVWNGQKVAKI